MAKPVNVLFVCGNGMGTSTMAEIMVNKALKNEGIAANVKHCALGEMNANREWADIFCVLAAFTRGLTMKPEEHLIPVVNIMDGKGIAAKIAAVVDEFYPDARN